MNKQVLSATIFTRLALSAGFFSAVADRFGGWGSSGESGVAWGNWHAFVTYTGKLAGWITTSSELIQGLAGVSTGLELVLRGAERPATTDVTQS